MAFINRLYGNDYPLVLDISHWQGGVGKEIAKTMSMDQLRAACTIDFAKLKEKGVKAIFAKCSDGDIMLEGDPYSKDNYLDPWFPYFCQAAYEQDIPFAAYHFFTLGPVQAKTKEADFQFNTLKKALQNKKFYAIVVDFEVPHCGSDSLSNTREKLEHFIDWIQEDYPGIPVMLYTNQNTYQAKLNNDWPWLEKPSSDLWVAQWIYKQQATTWENLRGLFPAVNGVKLWYPENTTPRMYQWATVKGLEGIGGEIDVNFWISSQPLYEYLNFTPKGTTPADPPEPGDPPVEPPVVVPGDNAVLAELQAVNAKLSAILEAVKAPRKITME